MIGMYYDGVETIDKLTESVEELEGRLQKQHDSLSKLKDQVTDLTLQLVERDSVIAELRTIKSIPGTSIVFCLSCFKIHSVINPNPLFYTKLYPRKF